jgi:hypothetical protein
MKSSDDDLDSLLKAWTVPPSPGSLEGRLRRAYRDSARSRARPMLLEATPVRAGFAAAVRRRRGPGAWAGWIGGLAPTVGKRLFAGIVAGAVAFLLVVTLAFPQSLSLIVPRGAITLDSEFLDYQDDGSSRVSEYRTSFVLHGGETILSSSFPGDPLRTAAGEIVNPVHFILDPIMQSVISPLFYRPGRAEHMRALTIAVDAGIRNGCAPTNMWGRPMTVIGKETVLNYTTTISQFRPEGRDVRFTEWFAPGLDCISLRSTTERALAGGVFRLASEKRVLKVTMNSSTTAAKEQHR